jgi:transglutaminase-like putative cysteine protease
MIGRASTSKDSIPSRAAAIPDLDRTSVLTMYFEASLYLMLLTAVLTLVSTGKLDFISTIAAPLALVWKGIRKWRGHGPELSSRVATIFVAAYFLYLPVDYLWAKDRAADAPNPSLYAALLATVHLLLFAMIVRLYSARTRRDSLFLAMLAFAAMLSAAVLTVGSAFLGFFLVFLMLGISTFVGLEVERGAEGAATPELSAGSPAAQRLVKALGVTSGSVAFAALVVGGLLFFLLPRFTTGYFGGYSLRPKLMTGFSESVELGQIGEIQKSTAVVMRIKVAGSPTRFMNEKWRGIALTRFDGRRWKGTQGMRRRVYANAEGWIFLSNAREVYSSAALSYRVLLEPVASDSVFVAPGAGILRGRFASGSGLGGDSLHRNFLLVDSTNSLFNPFPTFSELSYDAYSLPQSATAEQLRVAGEDYPEEINAQFLQTPELDPRIAALALEATAGATTPYDKAVALENYLRTRYGYTLDLTGGPGRDPLANFLFDRRAGHCEYFATAMTVMLRTLGIPSRYINGFQTGEYNDVGGDFVVRASDAHSWVEVYFPRQGWITFDPTPAGNPPRHGWFAGIAKYWDWFQLKWGEWVINYDFLHQTALAQGVGSKSREWVSGVRTRVGNFYQALVRRLSILQMEAEDWPWTPVAIGAALAGLVSLMGGRPLRERIARLWALRAGGGTRLSPRRASAQYQEMLRMLARRGVRKPEAATPAEFATSISHAELARPIQKLTELYQAARFGEMEVEPRISVGLLREIRQKLRTLRFAHS